MSRSDLIHTARSPGVEEMILRHRGPGPDPAPDSIGAAVEAGLALQIGRLATAMEAEHARRKALSEAIHPIDLPVSVQAGNGTIDGGQYGPKDGFCWDVSLIVAASFTAGTVTVYREAASDATQRFTFTSAGIWEVPSDVLILRHGQRLVFVAAGITGNVTISGEAIQIDENYLADYLM